MKKLLQIMNQKERVNLYVLIPFTLLIALIEMGGISLLMPFIAFASQPEKVLSNEYMAAVYGFFSFEQPIDFIIAFGWLLIGFFIFRAAANISHQLALQSLIRRFTQRLMHSLFRSHMALEYPRFAKASTGELRDMVMKESSFCGIYTSSIVQLISEVVVMFGLFGVLLYFDWQTTSVLFLALAVSLVLVFKAMKTQLTRAGRERKGMAAKMQQSLNELYGNFKFLKINAKEGALDRHFMDYSSRLRLAHFKHEMMKVFPRFVIESIGLVAILGLALYVLYAHDNPGDLLAVVGIYAVSFFRLAPSVNKIVTSYGQFTFSGNAVDATLDELKRAKEQLGDEEVHFRQSLRFEDVSFRYSDNPVIESLSLEIKAGEHLGLLGASGSGKTTLVDLLIGLLSPDQGRILIDSTALSLQNLKSWRSQVAYIPQNVYLFEGTVAENIAFGAPIDEERVWKVLELAQLDSFLKSKDGLDTLVGDAGISLSGGQRQRVAIARALYQKKSLIVFDEATSALDNLTEKKILDAVLQDLRDTTLVMITHRSDSLKSCDRILELSASGLKEKEKSSPLVQSNA